MKIYIIPVEKKLQPDRQTIIYPSYNDDYGVEQDFLEFLKHNKKFITNDIYNADWHYLPIYWTRWHLNHNFARYGREELQSAVDRAVIDPRKTFTICQYDDGPVINARGITEFLSSRKSQEAFDIPLLARHFKRPLSQYLVSVRKKYLASFVGRYSTHKIREEMVEFLKNKQNYYFSDVQVDINNYIHIMKESYSALCPRGYGGSSFRFYEAMQLGIAPILIGDIDTRPFKDIIKWSECSFYLSNVKQIDEILSNISEDKLIKMGKEAKRVWEHDLKYQKWCKHVISVLKSLSI